MLFIEIVWPIRRRRGEKKKKKKKSSFDGVLHAGKMLRPVHTSDVSEFAVSKLQYHDNERIERERERDGMESSTGESRREAEERSLFRQPCARGIIAS